MKANVIYNYQTSIRDYYRLASGVNAVESILDKAYFNMLTTGTIVPVVSDFVPEVCQICPIPRSVL